MMKYDAIVILSGPDEKTTRLRIEKGLELYLQGLSDTVVFNGFAPEDPLVSEYLNKYNITQPYILYAETTEENAYQTKKFAVLNNWKKLAIVSSRTHINNELQKRKNAGRVPRLFKKFFPSLEYRLDFITAEEPSEKSRKRRAVKEYIANLTTWFELLKLPESKDSESDKKIFLSLKKRKEKFESLNDLIKKVLNVY